MSLKAINLFVLGNSSILSLTLIPIVLINLFYKTVSIKDFIIPALISFFIVSLLTINFEPFISWKGGGVNHMISKLIFKNNIYFYFTSFFTITIFIFLFLEKKENILILTIILFMFFSSQVYQRYYEPMFFIIFFTLIKTNLINIFLRKSSSSLYLLLYFVSYYIITISDLVYKI